MRGRRLGKQRRPRERQKGQQPEKLPRAPRLSHSARHLPAWLEVKEWAEGAGTAMADPAGGWGATLPQTARRSAQPLRR